MTFQCKSDINNIRNYIGGAIISIIMYYSERTEKAKDIQIFVKPLYEKLKEEGFSDKDCLQIFETAVKLSIVDEMTK